MGMAAISYFEQGADLTEVARKLKSTAGHAVERLPRRRKAQPAALAPVVPAAGASRDGRGQRGWQWSCR